MPSGYSCLVRDVDDDDDQVVVVPYLRVMVAMVASSCGREEKDLSTGENA